MKLKNGRQETGEFFALMMNYFTEKHFCLRLQHNQNEIKFMSSFPFLKSAKYVALTASSKVQEKVTLLRLKTSNFKVQTL